VNRLAVIAALLLATAAPAQAKRARVPGGGAAPARADNFWERAIGGKAAPDEYAEAMRLGERQAMAAYDAHDDRRVGDQKLIADFAIRSFERAAAADPTRAEPHLQIALFIFNLELNDPGDGQLLGDKARKANRVLAEWAEFERLAPLDPRVYDYLNDRALLETKLATPESYAKAIADYERMIRYATATRGDSGNQATRMANMAEVCMMTSDLPRAIRLYGQSLEISPDYLAGFGLAVALDRDGQAQKAREVIRVHASEGHLLDYVQRMTGRSFGGNVFYVPNGEVHYYLGLIHDSPGHQALAISEYQEFIRARATDPAFKKRAQANIDDLRRQLKAGKGTTPSAKELTWWREWQAHRPPSP